MGEQFVDVQYRGLEVGRRQKMHDFGPTIAYLQHPTPLPVGTELEIHTDDGPRLAVSVLRVQEQVAGAERQPGAFVGAGELDEAGRAWWAAQVSVDDPVIPEVIPEPSAAEVEASAAGDEAAANGEAAAGGEEAAANGEAAAEKPAPTKRKRRSRTAKPVAEAEGEASDAKASDAEPEGGKRKRRSRRKKKS